MGLQCKSCTSTLYSAVHDLHNTHSWAILSESTAYQQNFLQNQPQNKRTKKGVLSHTKICNGFDCALTQMTHQITDRETREAENRFKTENCFCSSHLSISKTHLSYRITLGKIYLASTSPRQCSCLRRSEMHRWNDNKHFKGFR